MKHMPKRQEGWNRMGLASKEYCERLVGKYLAEIDSQEKKMEKNFLDMDLENVKIREDISDVVTDMREICKQLKTKINDYHFE